MGSEVTQRPQREQEGLDHEAGLTCQQLRKYIPEKNQFCILSLCLGLRWVVKGVAWTVDTKGPGHLWCSGYMSRLGVVRGLSGGLRHVQQLKQDWKAQELKLPGQLEQISCLNLLDFSHLTA